MFATSIFSRLLCLVGFFAVASVTTPTVDAANAKPDDGFCAAPLPSDDADVKTSCSSSPDHPDGGQTSFESTAPGVARDLEVRPVNSTCITYYHHDHFIRRLQQSRIAHSQELALWMFIEFLKAAPLLMVFGCIMMVFVALGQKWSYLADGEATSKIRWTKPVHLSTL